MSWLNQLAELTEQNQAVILLTVLNTRGSVPREMGTKMLVMANSIWGTIGGGNLEYQCIALARERLRVTDAESWLRVIRHFPLGARLGQCCGGAVVVMLEYITRHNAPWIQSVQTLLDNGQKPRLITPLANEEEKRVLMPGQYTESKHELADKARYFAETMLPEQLNITIFGAGHVGQALINVLAGIDCSIRWVDSRAEQFPAAIPLNTRKVVTEEPLDEVDTAPAGGCFIVMTHSHQLDYQLCEQILKRNDAIYCGLIGSLTKRRKFEQRMQARGMSYEHLRQLICPIGIAGIAGKEPGAIAVAVAAQLLSLPAGKVA